ncbi:uncharacterized protein N7473_012562 [Penicillium subrubescens]|jgi:hypothetical protein|nr:uncharacterized protein N7473_012562 [Penicillium subrubescens]KAJ5875215.1 hypothetical protein N7473_012562 [Penicillium subrubescens]
MKTGIYILIAVLNAAAAGACVGSASGVQGVHGRDVRHTLDAKASSKKRGILYDLLRKTCVKKKNRGLASFAPPLPHRKHLIVLEGILPVWFSTL